MTLTIAQESPVTPDLNVLMSRHTADMHADTPPESIHMMDASQLAIPEINFYVMRDAGVPVAMGAFKRLNSAHAEIKSMHVLAEMRGKGLSRKMLDHLVAEARQAGITQLSLETGAQMAFVAARKLYEKAGFQVCDPFEGYWDDPNSVFMTANLA